MGPVIVLEKEADGCWIAEIEAIPGCLAYGSTIEEAAHNVMALYDAVIEDRVKYGEAPGAR